MNKYKRLTYGIFILLTIFFSFILNINFIESNKVYAEVTDGFEFFIGTSSGEKIMSTEDFNTELNQYGDAELYLWVRSIGTEKSIGGYELELNFGSNFVRTGGPTLLQMYEYDAGRDGIQSKNLFTLMSSGNDTYSIGKNIDVGSLGADSATIDDYKVSLAGEKVAKFYVSTVDGLPVTQDNLEIGVQINAIGDFYGSPYDLSNVEQNSLVIGTGITAQPSTGIENLKVIGDSGDIHYEGTVGVLPAINMVDLTYQDSQQPLIIDITTTSETANISYSGASSPYVDQDQITVTITDGEVGNEITDVYVLTLSVPNASTLNNLSDLTINKGEITPAFDPSVTEYTVNLDYSESDLRITAAVDETDLSTLNTIVHDETFPVGTSTREFIVTAEDGTTKTYTINVVRGAASTDSSLASLYVDGQLVTSGDGTSYNYTLDELDSNFNFKVLANNEYANIEYKLSSASTYNNILSNTNSPNFPIDNDQLLTYDIRITAQDGSISIYQLDVYRAASTATDLEQVQVVEGLSTNTLTNLGGFYEYVLSNSGQTSITINTQVADYASVRILDSLDNEVSGGQISITSLAEGTHNYFIEVTAQDGITITTYPINIIKKSSAKDIVSIEAQDKDNSYTVFTFTGEDFTFDSATNTYSYKFDFENNNVRFVVESSPLSTITGSATYVSNTSNQGYFDVTLTNTSQSITLNVEAEDGSTKQYTVTFRKEAADSTNTLDDLQVDGATIDGFNPTKFSNYPRIILPGETTSVYVEGIINADVNTTILYNGLESKQISLVRGEVKTVNIKVTAEDGSYNIYTIEIVAANENNQIDNIIFNNINYAFDPNTTEYNFSVDYFYNSTNISVTTPTGVESVIFGDGSKVLNEGVNTFKVYVESEAGIKGTEYTFNITRNPARSDKYLDSLTVGTAPLVPGFLPGVYTYDVRVDESVTEVLITATIPDDNGSSIVSGTGTVSLQSGKTKSVDIVVQAEDGTKQTYTVNILRANDINTFDKITIDGIDYLLSDFNASNELILPEQPYSNKEMIVNIQKTDSFSSLTISPALTIDNEWLLSEGTNVLSFYITSQAGNKGTTYKVITTQTSPNTNNDLSGLEVLLDGVDLLTGDNTFSPNKFNYSIRVNNNTTGLTINASVDSLNRSSISGDTGNITLSFVTKIYTVTVRAEDGSTQDYNIEVTRQNDNNTITDISFDGFEDIVYDETKTTYDLGTVAYSISSLDLTVLLEDTSASIYVNNKLVSQNSTINLVEGNNSIEIYAVSEYGTKGQVYTYSIQRNQAQTKAELQDLEVLALGNDLLVGDLVFNPTTLTYEIRVDRSITSVSINAFVDPSDQSTITGDTGNNPLVAGENIFRVTVTAEDGLTKNTYLINVTRANDNNTITDISVDGQSIGFNPTNNTYNLDDVDFTVDSINIDVTLEDPYASVSIEGIQTLSDGTNVFEIYATSEYGTKGTVYTITVFKQAANTGNLLESLELLVGGVNVLVGDQAFIDTLNSYEVRIDNDINEVTINASAPLADRSSVTGTGLKTLSNTTQVLTVTVTAENGDVNEYKITIIRQNDNNTITDISFDGFEDIVYDETKTTYDLGTVAYSISSLDLTVLLEDTSASIYVNNKLVSQNSTINLVEGNNNIEIYAVSEYGTKGQVYTYSIQRNQAQTKAELQDLEVLALGNDLLVGDLVFNPTTLTYELRVDRSITSVSINAFVDPADQSTITGDTGNNPLVAGENIFRVTVTAEDGLTKNTYLINVTRANDNNTITDISVDGQSIGFDPLKTTYTLDPVTYDIDSIELSSILEDEFASINFDGIYNLVEGINTIEIFATSEFGTKGTVYTFTIEKYSANSNNLLRDLQVLVNGSNLLVDDLAFDPLTNIYNLRVDNDVTQIEILADVLESDRSTLNSSQLGVKNLIAGTNNSFKVTVKAEDGTENIYEINISSENNNYNITDISINGFDHIIFDPSIYEYNLGNVAYSLKSIDFSVLLEDTSATIRINGKVVSSESNHILNAGLNTFVIQVESEYGELGPEYTYTINQEEAMSNANLLDLEVLVAGNNLLINDLAFDPQTLTYELRVDRSVVSVDVLAYLDSQYNATYTGDTGSKPLSIGENIFDIHVTAEDKTTSKTYRVIIHRNNDDASINDIQIDGVTLPGFDPSVITYQMIPYSFDINSVEITATSNDPYATVYGTGTVNLIDGVLTVEVYAESDFGTKGQVYTIELERKAAFADTSLSDLVVYDNASNPLSFEEGIYNKNITGYTIKLDPESTITQINIEGLLVNSDKQTLDGHTGLQDLTIKTDGTINQTYSLTVTAESGDQKTYSITILKGTNLSSDASINRVTLTDTSGNSLLTFNALQAIQDDVILDYQTSIINLNVIPNDQKATVVGNGTFTINPDQTATLKFKVIAQDGTTESLEYTINVYRQAPSDDNLLSSLEVLNNGVDLLVDNNQFSSSKYTYTLKVDRSIEILDIKAIANHAGAKVTGDINQVLLVPGLQQLKVFVSAEDGSQRTYYINVEVVNSDIEIISLSVDSFDINYNPSITQYDLGDIASSFDTLNIRALIPSDSYGEISGDLGVVNLNYGLNFFTVTATSEDGSESVSYTIFANRLEPDANNYLSDLYVTDGNYRLPFSDAVFNKETQFYQIILDKTSKVEAIEIYATAENGTLPSGTGRHLLTSVAGVIHNDFFVTVTAENGEERTYQIQVIKADSSDLSTDTEIKDLTISTSENDYEVLFDGDIIKQEPIMLDYKESSFFVDVLAGEGATVYGNTLYKIQPGQTKTVEFYVEAENGDLSPVYSIEVSRPLPDSNNIPNRLFVLVDGQAIELDVSENYHLIDIPDTIGSIGIEAEITDSQYVMGTGTKVITKDNQKFYVVVTAEDGTPNAYTIEVDQKSDDATLKSIIINGVEMFGHFKGNYLTLDEVLFETDSIDIFATASHPNATITGNGQISLNVGRNIIEVYATSELGTQGQIYQIEITRGAPSSDASLNDLVVKDNTTDQVLDYTPVFNPDQLKYTIALTLEDATQEISIDAFPNSQYIQSIDGEGIYTLKTASAETTEIFTIKVVAEDGTIREYEVHVTREVDPNNDVTIDALSLYGEGINYLGTNANAINAFSMGQTEYNITIPYSLNSVYLSVTNLNGASVVGQGSYSLNNQTIIEFYLVSNSGQVQSQTYTITLTKEAASSNKNLSELNVDGILIEDFDPEVLAYELMVSFEDISSVQIGAIAEDENARVIGDLGNVNLSAGLNTINVTVQAEDGTSQTYQIIINRLSTDASLMDLFVEDYDMNYTFSQERIRYEVSVPYTTTYVEIGGLANAKANIINTGIKYLNVGDNAFEIYVIAESGLVGTVYELHVIREEVSTDSSLQSLIIRDAVTNDVIPFNPIFRPDTTEYIIELDKESPINSLMIQGIANDQFASVGGNGYKVLKAEVDGQYHNIFEVTVRAQDNSTTTYTISVYKDVNLSDSTQIDDLSLTGSDGIEYLGIEGANIVFSPNTYYYEIVVPYHVESMTLSIDTTTAKAYGLGTKTFIDDEMTFEAYIVSQSGVNFTEDYVIVVRREAALVDNTLDQIILNGSIIEDFDPNQNHYEIDIPYLSTDKVIISANPNDSSSRLSGNIGTFDLEEGVNVYSINVTAQNGEVNTYTVSVNYLNANAYLENLTVINPETEEAYPFTFNPETFEYTVNIDKNDLEVIVTGQAQDQDNAAIIGLGRYTINGNGSTAIINVIASDNETVLTYTININRSTLPSHDSSLKNLSVSGHPLAFNPDTKSYELSVDNEVSDLDVLAEANCDFAEVSIIGADDIEEGKNVILIQVDAEDGTQSFYQLTVHKDFAPDNFLTMLLIVSLLVWIITILVILIRSTRERSRSRKKLIK